MARYRRFIIYTDSVIFNFDAEAWRNSGVASKYVGRYLNSRFVNWKGKSQG